MNSVKEFCLILIWFTINVVVTVMWLFPLMSAFGAVYLFLPVALSFITSLGRVIKLIIHNENGMGVKR